MTRWEYVWLSVTYEGREGTLWIWTAGATDPEKRTGFKMVDVLNEFGEEGWELVSRSVSGTFAHVGFHHSETGKWNPPASYPRQADYWLKRPVDGVSTGP